jgi:hypothetical protein
VVLVSYPFTASRSRARRSRLTWPVVMTLPHFASPRDRIRCGSPGDFRTKDGDVNLDLGAVGGAGHHPAPAARPAPVPPVANGKLISELL